MRKILIVKTGTTFPTLRAIKGDFDAWVMRGFGRDRAVYADVAEVAAGEELPAPTDYAGIVVTGSHDMVTDRPVWSERTAEWLRYAVKLEIPTLGICYGHQLLAHAFGGRVGNNPNGPEYGTVIVTPNAFGTQDALLGEFQGPFKVHMCHQQSVLDLPKGAVPLASTRKEPCAAFSLNQCAWGVQFHPEFDSRILKAYVLRCKDDLAERGLDVKDVFASCMETGCGHEVFRRFLDVVDARSRTAFDRAFHCAALADGRLPAFA
jgi:GMP synthase (glutamine-hydrolysing)